MASAERNRLFSKVRTLFVAALGFALSTAVLAQSSPNTSALPWPKPIADSVATRMLVLDASGSMWKNVDDKNSPLRAELAAKFVETFTTQLANERTQRNLGMVRLGYQYSWLDKAIPEKTLCSDVEVVVPPASASQVRDKIAYQSGVGRKVANNDYAPKGQTPLKLAIEKAAYAAPPGGATLVVVTDLESDEKCVPDPCAENGKPIPSLEALLRERNIRIRYVIAAGLLGSIGDRAKRFASCFGAEYKVLDDLDQAGKLGTEVGLNLIRETPRPSVAVQPPPARGTIRVELQDADGQRVEAPPRSQLEVRRSDATAPLLSSPGQEVTEPGQYESSLSVGSRRWQIGDVAVLADRQTDIAFVVSAGILRMRLIDTDLRTIDTQSDTVWEISPQPGQAPRPTLRFKGARMNQALPAGSYHVNIYTGTEAIPQDITIEAGQELNVDVRVRQY
jgi:hypothetical protein